MSQKRNVPSWMSSRDPGMSGNKPHGKKLKDEGKDGDEMQKEPSKEENTRHRPCKEAGHKKASSSTPGSEFSKLMEGVVIVLSGFVNPERSTLRSQALAMGAVYQPDWNSDSTLLVSAFPNTPKFSQVKSVSGTVVSKEWITECYTQKKLVGIEQYLMHVGKPWRRNRDGSSLEPAQEKEEPLPKKSQKRVEENLGTRETSSASLKSRSSEVKKWAVDDLTETISWLESQDEKPEPCELKRVATEGILTCLQDAIDSLENNQDVGSITEQWSFVPRVVKELRKIEASSGSENSIATKKQLCKQAKAWKEMYVAELNKPDHGDKGKRGRINKSDSADISGYNSDDTIEMTEEEIHFAYQKVASSV